MWNKAVDNYAYALEFVSDCYKSQKMWNIVVKTYPPMQFIPECYKTEEMCVKAIWICSWSV